jgi:non-ribosomal peptide synthetase component F
VKKSDLEWVCRLSPQQRGMLFEALADPASGIHLDHLVCTLEGPLSIAAFREAWHQVLRRHAILRTGYVWERQDEPYQVVFREVEPVVEVHDRRGRSGAEIERDFERMLAEERRRGFDLHRPPLLRSALVRVAEDRHRWIWTSHHILMDGWCRSILLADLFRFYDAVVAGRKPEVVPTRPYGDFVAWLERQDRSASEEFWRRTLYGVRSPTPLGRVVGGAVPPANAGDERYGETERRLGAGPAEAIRRLARRRRVTLTTVLESAWAVLLSRLAASDDVVLGVTLSGRPPRLEGVQSMVGLFITTLPMRLRLRPEVPLADWLGEVQRVQLELSEHQGCSEGEVHRWSEVPGWLPLFESVLVVENYPLDRAALRSSELAVRFGEGRLRGAFTKYAATLLASEREEIGFRLVLDRRRLSLDAAARLLEAYVTLLGRIAEDPNRQVGELRSGILGEAVPSFYARPRPAPDGAETEAPRTRTEEILAGLWCEVLGVESVGVHDSFLHLGGHSLLAADLLGRVGSRFEVELPLKTLFEHPTVAELAAVMAEAGAVTEPRLALVPRPEERWEPFPLTEVQEVYWAGRSGLFDLGGGGSNLHMDFEAEGPFEPLLERLREVMDRLIERHDQLRMAVHPDGRQQVLPRAGPWELEVHDLRGLDEAAARRRVDDLREELCRRRAPIGRWPLFDVVAQRLDEERLHLHTRFDALMMDGESRLLLVQEMLDLFEDPTHEIPAPGCTFRDFAVAWLARRDGEPYRRAREHWDGRIRDLAPPPDLPLVREVGPETPPAFSRARSVLLEADRWGRFQELCGAREVTPSAVLTTAFVQALSRWNDGRAFTFCMIRSYRPDLHPDLHRVVGNFSNISVVSGKVDGTFHDRVLDLQHRLTQDEQHRELTGFEVVREWHRCRGPSARPPLPVWFNSVVEFAHPSFRRQVGRREATGSAGRLRFLDTVLYPPQTLLMATVGVGWDTGDLRCSWQALEEVLAPGLVEGLASDLARLANRLIDDESAWDAAGAREPPRARPRRPAGLRRDPPPAIDPRDSGASREAEVLARCWSVLLGRVPAGRDERFFDAGGDSIAAVRLVAAIRRDLELELPAAVLFRDGTFGGIAAWLRRAAAPHLA